MSQAISMSASNASPDMRKRPFYAWLWLCYTGFLFIAPILEPSVHLWLETLAVFFTFLVIFFRYVRASDELRDERFWLVGATMLLGLVAYPWNQGGSTFFVYTAAFVPFNVASKRRVAALFALEALLIVGESWLFHVNWANALVTMFVTFVIGGGNVFFAEQKRADQRLRAAQEENVALAALAERERIARDLHDVLGHTLSVIVLKAELAGRLLSRATAPDPQGSLARATAEINDVERITRTALAEVREAIGGYRARGLRAEIDAARRTLDAAGVTLLVEDQAESPATGATPSSAWTPAALSANKETVLSLGLREAVTNIVRHARATTCTLRFVTENGQHRLMIEDNGHSTATPREGNGLRGMRERVEALGGHFALDGTHGTRLQIALPCGERQRQPEPVSA